MNSIIEKPTRTTYYIAYNGQHPPSHYGVIEKNNVMETKYDDMETFTRKADFLKRCKELEIDTTELFDTE
jgi:hypothetical protein